MYVITRIVVYAYDYVHSIICILLYEFDIIFRILYAYYYMHITVCIDIICILLYSYYMHLLLYAYYDMHMIVRRVLYA